MASKNRSDLKSYFVKNAIPTEGNFADLIDSQLNQTQDGLFKPDGDALSVVAAPGDQKRVLRLYASYPAASPDWMISLHPAQDPANAATTGKTGLGITDGAGKTRLFIDAATGQIGVGTNTPQVALDVAGGVQANGFRGQYDLVLNDYRTVNPASNICLQSPGNDRDAWIYRDSAVGATTSNYGIYHRQIDTAVAGLPGNSIGFVGNTTLQAYIALGDGSAYFAGRVGIGTLAPNSVPGDKIILYDATATDRYGIGFSSSNINLFCPTNGRFSLRQNSATGTEVFKIDGASGNAWTRGSMTFQQPSGDNRFSMYYEGGSLGHLVIYPQSGQGVYLVSGTGWVNYSDLALKTDVIAHEPVLDRVMQLRPVRFTWKANGNDGSGFIAQEVETLFPDLVREGSVDEATGRRLKGMSYERFAVLAVAAIKELKMDCDARLDALERKLAAQGAKS